MMTECLTRPLVSIFVPPKIPSSIVCVTSTLSVISPFYTNCVCSHIWQATPELAENSSLLERAELHYQNCNSILDTYAALDLACTFFLVSVQIFCTDTCLQAPYFNAMYQIFGLPTLSGFMNLSFYCFVV
jgi:hypothetical protein